MTIYDAIRHAEEIAAAKEKEAGTGQNGCAKCAEEHRQLAKWLGDYKRLTDAIIRNDLISREAAKDDAHRQIWYRMNPGMKERIDSWIMSLPAARIGRRDEADEPI